MLFDIGADPSKAERALGKFGVSAEKMFKLVAGASVAAAGVLTGGRAERGGPVINVFVEGMISPDNLSEVIREISDQVKYGDVVLHATSAGIVTAKS